MKLIFISFMSLGLFSACSRQDVWKTTIDENEVQSYNDIHQQLDVAYSESENKIVVVSRFRNGFYGASIKLDGEAFVSMDSAPLDFNYSSAVGGGAEGSSYAGIFYNPPSLTKDYSFSWKARGSRRFENRVQLPSKFSLISSTYEVSRWASSVTLYYGGDTIAPNESVYFNIEGDFGYYINAAAIPVGQTYVILALDKYVDPSRFGSSTIVIHAFKARKGILPDSPSAGGDFTATYELPPLRISVY